MSIISFCIRSGLELAEQLHSRKVACGKPLEPLIGGPKLTIQMFRKRQVIRVIYRPLAQTAGQFQCPSVQRPRLPKRNAGIREFQQEF
ncbi:MAG: hypothetical protein BZY83_04220 [SAR202 cluster bacterium Casp-Chloro-G2]|nr:MAG: hypothetical protein BZY83_04220 [SAR202 cluster bacterium Casp-Chloro-G2]